MVMREVTKTTDTSSGRQSGHSNTRGQDGDFNILVVPIINSKSKEAERSFGNLAKPFMEEMHQEWVKEDKTKLNGLNIESG